MFSLAGSVPLEVILPEPIFLSYLLASYGDGIHLALILSYPLSLNMSSIHTLVSTFSNSGNLYTVILDTRYKRI